MDNFDEQFTESFSRIMGSGAYNPRFIARFYEIFLDSSPQIRKRFANTNMSHQKTMLHDSLLTLVDFNRHRRLSAQMHRLANIHGRAAQDIDPTLYRCWLDSLIQTVREFDERCDEQTELAWRLTLAPGICYMQFSYEHPDAI